MRKFVISSMLAVIGLTLNAATLYVRWSWVNGELQIFDDKAYITGTQGDYSSPVIIGPVDYVYARVDTGLEVTKWSWTKTLQQGDDEGYQQNTILTNSPKIPWQSEWNSDDVYLGVHLNWLKYTISFNANGGSGTMAAMNGLAYNVSTNLIANVFKKTGYRMSGWSKNAKATSATFQDKASVAGKSFGLDYKNKSVTLYAVWTPMQVEVTFDAQGGSVASSLTKLTFDAKYTLPEPNKTGYTFQGWYTSATGGNKVEQTGTSKFVEPMKLYARWTVNSYKIEVLVNTDGEGKGKVSSNSGTYNYGSRLTIQAYPDEGSTFTNWQDGNKSESREITVTGDKKYLATFNLLEYEVKFIYLDANDIEQTYTVKVKYGKAATPPSKDLVDKRNKYHFTGWGNNSYETVKGNMQVAALYAINQYTIRFSAPDATSGSMTDQVCTVDGQKTLLPNSFVKRGHSFKHWKCDVLGRTFADNAAIDALTNEDGKTYDFVAVWEANKYTLAFDAQGGTSSENEMQVTYGQQYGKLPTATRKGYEFSGWWTAVSGGSKVAETATVSILNDMTIFARWTAKEYTVTFDANGGDEPSKSKTTVIFGQQYGTLPTTQRTGYDFGGWKTGDKATIVYSTIVSIDSDHMLTADWTAKKFWVTLRPGSGTCEKTEIQVTYDEAYTGLPEAKDVTRTGYEFNGWFTSSTGGTQVHNGDRVAITQGQYLYAQYTAKAYNLIFDPAGGSCDVQSRPIDYDSQYGDLPLATRKGYDFNGWYDETTASDVSKYTYHRKESDQTLIAKWTAKTYTVKFDSNGGAGYMSNQSMKWDVETELSANTTIKRTGYTFLGWSRDRTARECEFADKAKIKISEIDPPEDEIILYALWDANHYTIRFDPNGGQGTMADINAVYDSEVTLPMAKATLTNGIMSFKGWDAPSGKQFADGATVSNLTAEVNGVVTLLAHWSDDYQVSYYANGATNIANYTQNISASLQRPLLDSCKFVLEGYTFAGWAVSRADATAGKVSYRDAETLNEPLGQAADVVNLWAVWVAHKYEITFYPNGGNGNVETRLFTYDVMSQGPVYSRAGYDFAGWTLDPLLNSTVSNEILNLTTEDKKRIQLFAVWTKAIITSPFSEAADCDHDKDDGVAIELIAETKGVVIYDDSIEGGNGKCVKLSQPTIIADGQYNHDVTMTAVVYGEGSLSFQYKAFFAYNPDDCSCQTTIVGYTSDLKDIFKIHEDVSAWKSVNYKIEGYDQNEKLTIRWMLSGYAEKEDVEKDCFLIDNVKWVPNKREAKIGVTFRVNDGTEAPNDIYTNITWNVGTAINCNAGTSETNMPVLIEKDFLGWSEKKDGAVIKGDWVVPAADTQLYAVWSTSENPEPTVADRPVIGEGFKFKTDARFDYVIWKKNDLMDADWTKFDTVTGNDQPVALPMFVDQQGFFKVEVIQRGSK